MSKRAGRFGRPWSAILAITVYREFYRDIGWDAPIEMIKPHLHADGDASPPRAQILPHHRQGTFRCIAKLPYSPTLRARKAAENAADFIGERIAQAHKLRETFEGPSAACRISL